MPATTLFREETAMYIVNEPSKGIYCVINAKDAFGSANCSPAPSPPDSPRLDETA